MFYNSIFFHTNPAGKSVEFSKINKKILHFYSIKFAQICNKHAIGKCTVLLISLLTSSKILKMLIILTKYEKNLWNKPGECKVVLIWSWTWRIFLKNSGQLLGTNKWLMKNISQHIKTFVDHSGNNKQY